jgi:hypothetical protein
MRTNKPQSRFEDVARFSLLLKSTQMQVSEAAALLTEHCARIRLGVVGSVMYPRRRSSGQPDTLPLKAPGCEDQWATLAHVTLTLAADGFACQMEPGQ